MASRLLANLLAMGGAAVARAMTRAWSKAIENARASGAAANNNASAATSSSSWTRGKEMSVEEARKILDVSANEEDYEKVLAKFRAIFAANDSGGGSGGDGGGSGSFYVQSKVFRAKETLAKRQFDRTDEEASHDPRRAAEDVDDAREGAEEAQKEEAKRGS